MLGIRPKVLTQMTNLKRAFYCNTYVYDPIEISDIAKTIIKHPKATI